MMSFNVISPIPGLRCAVEGCSRLLYRPDGTIVCACSKRCYYEEYIRVQEQAQTGLRLCFKVQWLKLLYAPRPTFLTRRLWSGAVTGYLRILIELRAVLPCRAAKQQSLRSNKAWGTHASFTLADGETPRYCTFGHRLSCTPCHSM